MPTLDTKIKRTKQAILDLQNHLRNLEAKKAAIGFQSSPLLERVELPANGIKIVFDGGTSCNNPKQGFGKGYGSYQINGDPVVSRIQFGMGHSCNSAEIRTLHAAIEAVVNRSSPEVLSRTHLVIFGDSKIALKWANPRHKEEPAEHTWKEFKTAIAMLRVHLPKFASIKRIWHPRAESVKLFGH
jgi:ribonuclease HI